jgi:glycosyltransferase involved in cell wall biosynthesis
MSQPRMLMLAPALPWPGTTGGLVRIGALARQMARHFDVTFVSPREPGQRVPQDLAIRFVCPEVRESAALRRARALFAPSRPFHVVRYSYEQVRRIARRELAEGGYALVFGHFIYSLEHLPVTDVPVVIDQQNVDREYWGNKAEFSRFPLNVFAAWNARKTIAYERRRLPRVWAYVSVSDEDRERTRAYARPDVRHFWVAPNGVDTGRFTPEGEKRRGEGDVTLGYLGSMDLQMNVDAVQRFIAGVLPRIRRALDGIAVNFLVIGREPSPAIRKLAQATPGVTLTGTVADVVPWLRRVDILVCPLRIGAGTKLKVAEAMSCALPVVGFPLAFAGLPGRSGEHFVQTDTDDAFVEAICRLTRNPCERAAMGRAARDLARGRLDWDAIGDRLAQDIRDALAANRPSTR